MFVAEQGGKIRTVRAGKILPKAFLNISAKVGRASAERGLLGLAFHPKYKTNGLFYVNYTDLTGATVIAEYRRSSQRDRALPDSERIIIRIELTALNHNGGMVAFGPDGYLYIGMGDSGGIGDPLAAAQRLDTLLGKILRIDVDTPTATLPYTVPADNPYAATAGALPEIFAVGLRNPWRFSFDRTRGDLWLGDVGQDTTEEVDWIRAGRGAGVNFGWNHFESDNVFSDTPLARGRLITPIAHYSHRAGCAVISGYVYRGKAVPSLRGRFIYGDFCRARIWSLRAGPNPGHTPRELTRTLGPAKLGTIVSFGEDGAGELLVNTGYKIFRFTNRGTT